MSTKTKRQSAARISLAVLGLSALTILGGRMTALAAEFGQQVDFEAKIAPSLHVEIPADPVVLNLIPELGKEVFTEEDFTIAVATNNPTGYRLFVEADSTDLTRTEADNYGNYAKMQTLDAGEYTQDNFTVNRWGYKQDAGNYGPFATNITLAESPVPTNITETTLTFGAKVDMQQEAGTYKLVLNFQATSNVVPGVETINFDGNGADNPTAMAAQQIEAGKSANLTPNAFTRTNYNFLGWNTAANGSGTSYADKALYEVALTEENTSTTLYAQWAINTREIAIATTGGATGVKIDGTTYNNGDTAELINGQTYNISGVYGTGYEFSSWSATAGSIAANLSADTTYTVNGAATLTLTGKSSILPLNQMTYMQDATAGSCAATAEGATATLIDKRDNITYKVAKINGICTMTENLALGASAKNSSTVVARKLTSDDSNVTRDYTTTTNSLTTSANSSSTSGYTTPAVTCSSTSGYGCYYNYMAATAGEISGSATQVEATQSVCPKGWRLPTGAQNDNTSTTNIKENEQFILNNSYTWQSWNSGYPKAFSPVAAGYYDNGSLYDSGANGYWWSSTASSDTDRYYLLYYTSNGLYSGINILRYYGLSVRCVAL